MPEIAANTTSASIVSWSMNEGDTVAAGDCLAEIESEKAVVELEAEQAGVLGRILVQAGNDASVGAPIAVLLQAGEEDVELDALLAQEGMAPPETAESAGEPSALEPDAVASSSGTSASHSGNATSLPGTSALEPNAADTLPVTVASQRANAGRIAASPLARRLAHDSGISLSDLAGSGPQGRIVKRDVLAAGVTAGSSSHTHIDIPHTSMRRTIARRLSESKATIPHFYLRADCRMDALLALRAQINAHAPRKISVNDIIIKATAAALRDMPDMNVSWTDEALRRYKRIDISVAVSTDNGLITPVVRDVEGKSLSAISAEIADLAQRARRGGLAPHEYQGGSFTISNLGMFGVREFAAIINPPQAAILAVGAVEQRPVVVDGGLAVASVMTVTLSVDHRAIDGALAARWLDAFKRIIESPALALI
jgi:pyruvate dehydrogenase E2 component (dihydrolipoamide acetyltransferase)